MLIWEWLLHFWRIVLLDIEFLVNSLLSALCHPLASMVSDKSDANAFEDPLYVMSCFSCPQGKTSNLLPLSIMLAVGTFVYGPYQTEELSSYPYFVKWCFSLGTLVFLGEQTLFLHLSFCYHFSKCFVSFCSSTLPFVSPFCILLC